MQCKDRLEQFLRVYGMILMKEQKVQKANKVKVWLIYSKTFLKGSHKMFPFLYLLKSHESLTLNIFIRFKYLKELNLAFIHLKGPTR